MSGPLTGVRVLEFTNLAPVPFAATMLSDLGADVVRVDRHDAVTGGPARPGDPLARGRRSIALDLKHPEAVAVALRLVESADVLVEGFRPGVCERLGIGPDACLAVNPRLVYARISGWGQDGPGAKEAGHDLDYLAASGALAPIGPSGAPPTPPLNYVADFAGGGMLAVVGILAALCERERSGRGQVVDAAMVEGAALLSAQLRGLLADGMWTGPRGGNLLDGGAPFYRCYTCADGRFVAVAALEPRFYAALLAGLGLVEEDLPGQYDEAGWPLLHETFAAVLATGTRDEWAERFAGTDACVTPVLDPAEAPHHPQAAARRSFVDVGGQVQPAPAPRLSRTPSGVPGPAPVPGAHTREVLAAAGFGEAEVRELVRSGAVAADR